MSRNSVNHESMNGAVVSEIKFAGSDRDIMFQPKHTKRMIRVLTVVAYLFSVSLAAIMLSLFYVLIYSPGSSTGKSIQDQKFSQLPTQATFDKVSQESLDLINGTNLNIEKEEPRVLPMKGINDTFQIQSGVLSEYDPIHFNYTNGSGRENKSLDKIMKYLKAE